jgi:tetratricopeptide (TPR) repeat protein
VPLDLGVEYGRTPQAALSDGWGYVAWALPVGLFGLCFSRRRRHAIAWLGALLFGAFLLPTLGLIPFSFQAHSTVADRYAYLPMLGMGLVVADVVATVPSVLVTRAASAVILLFAVRAFDQTSHWLDNVAFLRHTLEVNPNVAFAQNNLGTILLKEQRIDEAIRHFDKALELGAGHALAQNNLGLALVAEGRLAEAEPHFQKAVELDPAYFRAYENLGAVYLRTNRFDEAIVALKRALELKPSEAKALNDLGIACMRSRRAAEGVDAFQRAVALEPDNASYRKNLEVARSKAGAGDEDER